MKRQIRKGDEMRNRDESDGEVLQMDVKVQAGETDKKELLRGLDEWFRHAETIGQARLGTFLTTEGLLVAACAFLWDTKGERAQDISVAIFISVIGALFSVVFFFLARRQKKFHQYIEHEADEAINEMPAREVDNSAFAKVQVFHHASARPVDEGFRVIANLNKPEAFISARKVMGMEAIAFLCCFVILIVAGAYKLHAVISSSSPHSVWNYGGAVSISK